MSEPLIGQCIKCGGSLRIGHMCVALDTPQGESRLERTTRELTPEAERRSSESPAPLSSKNDVTGRLAKRPYLEGDPLPAVGTECLVAGANTDVESDQHRAYGWVKVIGYAQDDQFVCFQKDGCWPFVERLSNCWFAEIPEPRCAVETEADGCICKGNWRMIVKECEPLLDQCFIGPDGAEYYLIGILHGSDDYYYAMRGGKYGLALLSCVGSIESFGYTLAESPGKTKAFTCAICEDDPKFPNIPCSRCGRYPDGTYHG